MPSSCTQVSLPILVNKKKTCAPNFMGNNVDLCVLENHIAIQFHIFKGNAIHTTIYRDSLNTVEINLQPSENVIFVLGVLDLKTMQLNHNRSLYPNYLAQINNHYFNSTATDNYLVENSRSSKAQKLIHKLLSSETDTNDTWIRCEQARPVSH